MVNAKKKPPRGKSANIEILFIPATSLNTLKINLLNKIWSFGDYMVNSLEYSHVQINRLTKSSVQLLIEFSIVWRVYMPLKLLSISSYYAT